MYRKVFHSVWSLSQVLQWLAVVAVLTLTVQAQGADNSTPLTGPPASWVKPQFFSHSSSSPLVESGSDEHVLLLERQINAAGNETFVHCVRQILTTAGVQNGATLKMSFNPSYQTLTLHWVRIWRGSEHLERLDIGKVKVMQQEKELDDFILNGRKSAVLVLEDVRIGDIIDYSYSIKGENPVFAGHFSDGIPVQMQYPAERLLTRVLWPADRHLYARPHGCAVQPVAVAGKSAVEYTWDLKQVAELPVEDALPIWCDPEPWVQLSEFKTWADVNRWALSLFQLTSSLSPELSAKIAEWKKMRAHDQQVLAALRFVQDDVRYFGIEIGASTEKPADPSTVFSRRFGDCKDKSLLFVTMLRALGMDAYPVLVNATSGRGIDDWLPSDSAFDHCIAVVVCDGQTYWLDPTMTYQRGSLALHYIPPYERGLVISPRTTALSVIPHFTGYSQTAISEYFQMGAKNEPAELKVVTVATGCDADSIRALFATTKRSDIEKADTLVYSDLYSGIKMSSPVIMEDDPVQDRVQTTEFYTIENAWETSDRDHKYRFSFYPSSIASALRKPVTTDRRMPLGIAFPRHLTLRTEVTMPIGIKPEGEKKNVSDDAFTFSKHSRCVGNRFVTDYEYQSVADSVSPDRMAEYLQHLNRASQSLSSTLEWR